MKNNLQIIEKSKRLKTLLLLALSSPLIIFFLKYLSVTQVEYTGRSCEAILLSFQGVYELIALFMFVGFLTLFGYCFGRVKRKITASNSEK